MKTLRVGTKVRHPNFKNCVGVITEVYAGEEATAEFGNKPLYFEPIENFTIVGDPEPTPVHGAKKAGNKKKDPFADVEQGVRDDDELDLYED